MKRLFAALLFLTACVLAPAPADAAACSGTSGVTVVVQFPDNHTEIGCAPGDPTDGLHALTGAGFAYTTVPNQQGAVCTINGQPASNCWGSSYWAYFESNASGGWTYSNLGAGSTNPAPGTAEGWRFGGGAAPTTPPPTKQPTYKPSRLPVVPPPAPTTHTPRATSAATAGSGTGVPTTSAPTSGATGAGVPAAPSPGQPTALGTATTSTTATADSTAAAGVGQVTTPLSTPSRHGGGLSWIWGVVLVVVLAAAGGVAAVRRKRA